MKKLFLLFWVPTAFGADIVITNIPHSTSVAPTDYVLGLTNGAAGKTRLIPVSQLLGGVTNGFVKKAGDTMTGPLNINTINLADGSSFISLSGKRFDDGNGNTLLDIGQKLLNDASATTSIDWQSRTLKDQTGATVLDWNNGISGLGQPTFGTQFTTDGTKTNLANLLLLTTVNATTANLTSVVFQSLSPSTILGLNGSKQAIGLVIGSGLSSDGTTLTATSGGGSGIATTNGFGTNTTFYSTGGNAAITTTGGTSNYLGGTTVIAALVGQGSNYASYAVGNPGPTLGNSGVALVWPTTTPTVVLAQTGTYALRSCVTAKYTGVTYAGAQTMQFYLVKTNGGGTSPLGSSTRNIEVPVLTTFTGGDTVPLPEIIYNATAGDGISLFGDVSATPSAGSIVVTDAEIIAIKLH
jgi:hypothetical protein